MSDPITGDPVPAPSASEPTSTSTSTSEPTSTSAASASLPSLRQVAKMIDHSLLRPELTADDVEAGLALALAYDVASVCVRPCDVALAARRLAGSDVAVGTVVGFPHGSVTGSAKVAETREALHHGAVEIDMVLNIGRLRGGDVGYVENEIALVVQTAHSAGAIVKVIAENAYLSQDQKVAAYQASERAGADFVKTSTGFAPGGATAEDIALMRASVSDKVKVKAAGGVRTLDRLLELHALGAVRFGATATAVILDDLAARLDQPPGPEDLANPKVLVCHDDVGPATGGEGTDLVCQAQDSGRD